MHLTCNQPYLLLYQGGLPVCLTFLRAGLCQENKYVLTFHLYCFTLHMTRVFLRIYCV